MLPMAESGVPESICRGEGDGRAADCGDGRLPDGGCDGRTRLRLVLRTVATVRSQKCPCADIAGAGAGDAHAVYS